MTQNQIESAAEMVAQARNQAVVDDGHMAFLENYSRQTHVVGDRIGLFKAEFAGLQNRMTGGTVDQMRAEALRITTEKLWAKQHGHPRE